MNTEELLQKQERLQRDARDILTSLDLLSFLSNYGKVNLVGSVASGLMTWPDIDIEVIKPPQEHEMWETAQYLFKNKYVKQIAVGDYRVRGDNLSRPKGLYLGLKYQEPGKDKWKIDLWFKEENPQNKFTQEWIQSHLTPENKVLILQIKEELATHPKYRSKIFSTDIYEAVFEKGIKNIEELKQYLKDTKNFVL